MSEQETTEQTVSHFDFGEVADIVQAKDLVGWNVALLGTDGRIESDQFVDEKTGEPQIGIITHLVAYDPSGGYDGSGNPKLYKYSDPTFPAVMWQTILRRVALASQARGSWITLRVDKTEPNARGRSYYRASRLSDELVKDTLYAMCQHYAEMAGFAPDEPLSTLTRTEALEIEAPE